MKKMSKSVRRAIASERRAPIGKVTVKVAERCSCGSFRTSRHVCRRE